MDVKFEIGTINNAEGKGKVRQFVKLQQGKSISADELASAIEHECTLSSADIKAVFTALRYHVENELSNGKRLHVPGLGYLSLSASIGDTETKRKITGRDVYLRGINFLPESSLLAGVRRGLRFTRARRVSRSMRYDADELWEKVAVYLASHHYITCRDMRSEFGLSDRLARRWLATFVEQGRLVKAGSRSLAMYFRKE